MLFRYLSSVIAVLAPWQGVFVFFFKVGKLMSVAVFLIGFFLAPMLFRVRFGKQIRARREREQSELEEQRKKEERGLWK